MTSKAILKYERPYYRSTSARCNAKPGKMRRRRLITGHFPKYPTAAITFGDPHNIALIPGFDIPTMQQVLTSIMGL